MSLNTVKYKGELLAEDERISTDTPGVLGEYKELRADALEADTLDITVLSDSGTIRNFKKTTKSSISAPAAASASTTCRASRVWDRSSTRSLRFPRSGC